MAQLFRVLIKKVKHLYILAFKAQGLRYAHFLLFRTSLHLGTRISSFEKSPNYCQPLQFHGHNFTVVEPSNQSSFVDILTKLLTLAVIWSVFGPARILPNQHCITSNFWVFSE